MSLNSRYKFPARPTPKRSKQQHRRIFGVVICLLILLAAGLVYRHSHQASNRKATAVAVSRAAEGTTTKPQQVPPATVFNKSQFSTTDPSSPWVIVNKKHPLNPKGYAPAGLTAVGNGQYMRAAAASALSQMLAAAQAAGYSVSAASGYRSYATQVSVYASEVNSYGQAVADSESARPGYSEHQTGWAVDLASDGCSINDCFGLTPGGIWVTDNAYRYGFILRYTAANSAITGYRAETWHFRYVGAELSEQLHQQGVSTLESFFGVSGGGY